MAVPSVYQEPLKRCPRCRRDLPRALFWANRTRTDGRTAHCKECLRVMRGTPPAPIRQLPLPGWKCCTTCGLAKPAEAFSVDRRANDGHLCRCKPCEVVRVRAYADEHTAEIAAWHKTYYEANKGVLLARAAEYRRQHRDELCAYFRRFHQEHRDYILGRMRLYRSTHQDQLAATLRARRQANHALFRARERVSLHKRRARLAQVEGHHTAADITQLFVEQSGVCAYCPAPLDEHYHVDHKIPICRGGSNWPANLALACPPCNMHKHDKTPEEFAAWQESVGAARRSSGPFVY